MFIFCLFLLFCFSLFSDEYPLTSEDSLGPFNRTGRDLTLYVHTLHHMLLEFDVRSENLIGDVRTCYDWHMHVSSSLVY